ncbi:MAG: hypothetical protein JHC93_08560, partial [Parachlamydiales bacterium]|nr:hypothetical protein [Parachlamydiales bacterium]
INNYFLLALQPIIARLYFTELPDSLKQIQNIHSINDSLKEGRENSFLDELSKDIQSQITEEVIAEEIQKIIENDPLTILVQCHQWLKDVKKLKIIPLNNEHINDIGRRQKQVRESLGTLNYCLMLIYSQWDQSNNNNQMALMDAVYYRASIFLEQALKLVINFLPIALPERSDKHQIFSEVSRSGSHVKLKTIHDIKFLVNMLDKYLLDSNILWKLPENLDAYLDEWTLVISQQGRYPGIKSGVIANDEIDMSKLYNKRERLQYIHNRLIHNVGLSENQKEELTAIESDPSKQLECIADRLSDVDVCIREILDRAKDKGCMALKVALATFNVIKEFK